MTSTPNEGGEGSIFGASGILGVNNLQHAIDAFDHAVNTLSQVVGRIGQASSGWSQGATTAGSWNKFSNWAGGVNGGPTTFGGTPFNPNGQQPQQQGGAHRASGPPQLFGSSSTMTHRAQGNGVGKAMFAASMVSQGYQKLTQTKSDSNSDSMVMLATSAQSSFGQAVPPRAMFGNGWYGMNGGDIATATYTAAMNSGNLVNSAGYNQYMGSVKSQTLANPMITAAQAAQTNTSFYSPGGYSKLRTVGITTVGNNGQRQSVTQIANQVLNQVDPNQTVRDPQAAAELVGDPMSALNVTLGNWVGNGIIDGNQVQAIKDQIQMILKARQQGVNAQKLNTLIQNRAPGNAADQKLKSMRIGNSSVQKEKDLASAQRQPTVDRLPAFNQGLTDAVNALRGFTDAVRSATSSPGNPVGRFIGKIQGQVRGETSHGILGAIGSEFGGLINPINPWSSQFGNFSGGGNETRMSVISGAGSAGMAPSADSSGSAAFSGISPASSGNPYKVGQEDGAVGGAKGKPKSGGGGTAKGGSKSKVIHLIWPCHGPITARFGQSGTHWSSGFHTGLDIGVPTGTPIHAAAPGVVITTGYNSAYGNWVRINHGNGIITLYGHNSRVVTRIGAHVRQGQLIAYSGATGNVTGPHCHFEVDINGRPVDPLKYLRGAGLKMSDPGALNEGAPGGGGAGSSGSGTTSTTSPGVNYVGFGIGDSGGAGDAAGVGASELDILSGALSGASAGGGGLDSLSTSPTTTSSGGGGGGGGGGTSGGGKSGGNPGKGLPGSNGSVSGNQRLGRQMAARMGWTGKQWDALLKLWTRESGWATTADNPTSSAYGIPQAMLSIHKVPHGYYDHLTGSGAGIHAYGGNPKVQIAWGLNYIKGRYHNPVNAWAHETSMNWYDKGAWKIPKDEVAKVHKDEMIVPAMAARQIREILVNGNPYKELAKSNGVRAGATITLAPNSVTIHVTSSGNAAADGRAIGKAFVDTLTQDTRIKNLQNGI